MNDKRKEFDGQMITVQKSNGHAIKGMLSHPGKIGLQEKLTVWCSMLYNLVKCLCKEYSTNNTHKDPTEDQKDRELTDFTILSKFSVFKLLITTISTRAISISSVPFVPDFTVRICSVSMLPRLLAVTAMPP